MSTKDYLYVGIPATSMLSVLLWLGSFLSDSWQVANLSLKPNIIVSAGLGRILFQDVCGDESTNAGQQHDPKTACEQRIDSFCNETYDNATYLSSFNATQCRVGPDTFAIRQSVTEGSVCNSLINCDDALSGLHSTSATVLTCGFVSSLSLVIGSAMIVMDNVKVAKSLFLVAVVVGAIGLIGFLFLTLSGNHSLGPVVITQNLGFFNEDGGPLEFPGSFPNAAEKPAAVNVSISSGFWLGLIAVALSCAPLALVLLNKDLLNSAERVPEDSESTADEREGLLAADAGVVRASRRGSASPSAISQESVAVTPEPNPVADFIDEMLGSKTPDGGPSMTPEQPAAPSNAPPSNVANDEPTSPASQGKSNEPSPQRKRGGRG